MLDLKGIEKTLDKLKRSKVEGEEDPGYIECIKGGRAEIRYSYYFGREMIFTFGITRGTGAKSKKFYYVPEQIKIKKPGI